MYNPVISCRLNRKAYAKILALADLQNEKKSKVVQHILDGLSSSEMSSINQTRETSLKVLAQLSTLAQTEINQRKRIGTNVNQIAKRVNTQRKLGQPINTSSLEKVHDDLKKMTKHDKKVDKEVSRLWRTLE